MTAAGQGGTAVVPINHGDPLQHQGAMPQEGRQELQEQVAQLVQELQEERQRHQEQLAQIPRLQEQVAELQGMC